MKTRSDHSNFQCHTLYLCRSTDKTLYKKLTSSMLLAESSGDHATYDKVPALRYAPGEKKPRRPDQLTCITNQLSPLRAPTLRQLISKPEGGLLSGPSQSVFFTCNSFSFPSFPSFFFQQTFCCPQCSLRSGIFCLCFGELI